MKITIYGKADCPFCVKAKQHARTLPDAEVEYIDIQRDGVKRETLEGLMGKSVKTVPQILINDSPVGGYQEFVSYTTPGA